MANDSKQFSIDIGKFAKGVPEKANALRRGLAIEVLSGVVRKSPVDTGRFRGNWQVTAEAPATAPVERLDKEGGRTIADGVAAIEAVEPGSDIWISNNVAYAVPLENGHSQQAPAGVVALTVAEVEGRFL